MADYSLFGRFSIDCEKYIKGDEEFYLDESKIVRTNTSDSFYATFVIKCDNMDDNESYTFDYYGSDTFVVERNRCYLNVYIKPNKTPFEKTFTIICTHANDSGVNVQIEIIQKEEEYELSVEGVDVEPNEVVLESIIKSGRSEKKTINVNVLGGSNRFSIESILKCHDDLNTDAVLYSNFDNGFIYNQFDDRIELINYGRPFLNEKDYYILKICHKDYKELKAEIKISYVQESFVSLHNRRNAVIRNKINLNDINEKYKQMDSLIEESQINEAEDTVVRKIVINHDYINNLVLYGMPVQKEIPFLVFENDEISDLEVKAFSSCKWCTVNTDATNRKAIIKIIDKPVLTRNAMITISIIDYPEISVNFILTNKPYKLQV